MLKYMPLSTFLRNPRDNRRCKFLRASAATACCWAFFATAASAAPVIVNQPFSAKAGDVVSLQGSGFGPAPTVYLKPSKQTAALMLPTKTADDANVVFEVPKTSAFDLYEVWISNGSTTSPHVFLNAPKPLHFDNAEIASSAHFRVFGRNLYVNNIAPTVTLIDAQTNATVKTTVMLMNSTAYGLDVVPAPGVAAGHSYQVSVSNGYASAVADAAIPGHAPGTDHFLLGQPWTYDFLYQDGPGYKAGVKGTNLADHHLFNVKMDPTLKILAKGDGKANDAAAIQGAINAAAAYGGVVYLPAGIYNIGATKIDIKANVVLQGQNSSNTQITFGPDASAGFIIDTGGMSGIADLYIQNVDLSSNPIVNVGSWGQPINKFFIQRVVWNLGSGQPIGLKGDRIIVLNSTFSQAINYQNGNVAQKIGGVGPLYFSQVSNLQFKNNTIRWATDQNSMNDLVNAVIENNHFTRSASDMIAAGPAQASWTFPFTNATVTPGQKVARTMGRQLTINFGKNVVVQSNVFDVSDGALSGVHNDGETILNEAGGQTMREDWGTVTAADSSSVADNSRCPTCAWNVRANSMVIIVSGAGAGQWRHIIAQTNNTFKVDAPFDVTPKAGDHFAISVPAYENAIIRNNTASGNPFGIAMYHGAYLNVSVVGNTLTNNGGIYLVSEEQLSSSKGEPGFDTSKNIEINENTLTNTNGSWPSYIAISYFMIAQPSFWGRSVMGAEIRNNRITARAGTPLWLFPEGYRTAADFQMIGQPYAADQAGAMFGTVFQGNSCTNCAVNYTLSTGAVDTTIWNAISVNSPGVGSTAISDFKISSVAPTASTGTLVGND